MNAVVVLPNYNNNNNKLLNYQNTIIPFFTFPYCDIVTL